MFRIAFVLSFVLMMSVVTTAQTQIIQTITSVGQGAVMPNPLPGGPSTPLNLGARYCEFGSGLQFGLQGIPTIFLTGQSTPAGQTPMFDASVVLLLNVGPATSGVFAPGILDPIFVNLTNALVTPEIPLENVGPGDVLANPCAFPAPFPTDPGPAPSTFTAGFQYESNVGGFSVPTGSYPVIVPPGGGQGIGVTFTFQAVVVQSGSAVPTQLFVSNAIQVN